MEKIKFTAIIPARSGSKGFKNKNINLFFNTPLLIHSINFAKKLRFVNQIIVSTDSEKFANISKKAGAEVPFLRSNIASKDSSMEEDVLKDIKKKCLKKKYNINKYILWLRPTSPLRDLMTFKKGYDLFCKKKKSVLICVKTESRIFFGKKKKLIPILNIMKKRSMVRRQELPTAYKIFYGEFFRLPKKINRNYLGKTKYFIEMSKICSLDIDSINDLKLYEKYINNNKKKFIKFLHT
jgi:CMP-N-acetylneuraminic acid synthetase